MNIGVVRRSLAHGPGTALSDCVALSLESNAWAWAGAACMRGAADGVQRMSSVRHPMDARLGASSVYVESFGRHCPGRVPGVGEVLDLCHVGSLSGDERWRSQAATPGPTFQ